MKIKEFAQLDKYPYANEGIRQDIAKTAEALDNTLEAIESDPTLNAEAKTLLKYQKGREFTQKLAQSIQKSIQTREQEAQKLRSRLKSVQLRKEPLKEDQKAVMGIVYDEIKNGNINVIEKANDNLLKIALTLADNGLIDDISGAIDMQHSGEAMEGLIAHRELMEFEQKLLETIREYEKEGLSEDEAMRIYSQVYKG